VTDRFPYSNWGAGAAVLGVILAIGTGVFLSLPAIVIDSRGSENTVGYVEESPKGSGIRTVSDSSTGASIAIQLATVAGFLIASLLIASSWGARSIGEALRRLGVRAFRPSAVKWMAAAVGAYLLFAYIYVLIVGAPEQEDIAESFGPVAVQILLIVFAASISEEVCFRGMLYGGLRERFPRYAAALLSAVVFGGLHAATGISAVPPLIAFGFVLALLYERTGSIVPGIILHAMNNSVALLAQ